MRPTPAQGVEMNKPPQPLTHLDEEGRPRMVDVTQKDDTRRRAVAEGSIRMAPETLQAIQDGTTPKGNVLQIAQIAGIQGGKRSGELIPLCHVLPGASLSVTVEVDPGLPGVRVKAEAKVKGQTGVEMEALTAVSVALLTVYDMVKAMDRGMVLEGVQLVSKEGGKSGKWSREDVE
jgi:cyclic pyranopterin phosphate synthase